MSRDIAILLLALVTAPAFAAPASPPPASLSFVAPTASANNADWYRLWQKHYAIGKLSGDVETSIGRWSTDRPPTGSAWLTQSSPAPVLFVQLRYGAHVR
jgi:hypothetical protein